MTVCSQFCLQLKFRISWNSSDISFSILKIIKSIRNCINRIRRFVKVKKSAKIFWSLSVIRKIIRNIIYLLRGNPRFSLSELAHFGILQRTVVEMCNSNTNLLSSEAGGAMGRCEIRSLHKEAIVKKKPVFLWQSRCCTSIIKLSKVDEER